MMQFATFLTDSPTLRNEINHLLNCINYIGMLSGYISSGLAITYIGYHYCFFLNAAAYCGFGISVFATKFPVQRDHDETKRKENSLRSSVQIIRSVPQLRMLFTLTFALWLTGGSINVLEVPFLKKTVGATDLIVSLLFFTSALGAIGFSFTQNRPLFEPIFERLPIVIATSGALILLYVLTANVILAVPMILLFGYLTSFCNVISMNALQTLTPEENLGDATLAFNTTVQTTTLLAAAAGVFLSQFSTEQWVCVAFASITIIIGICLRLKTEEMVS
jgi:Na+/melibiose symporter-like transporter